MPLYELICLDGHLDVQYCKIAADYGCETRLCPCGSSMARVLSLGVGRTYFRENHPIIIENLGPTPRTFHNARAHEAAMKAEGVTWATKGPGEKGSWV